MLKYLEDKLFPKKATIEDLFAACNEHDYARFLNVFHHLTFTLNSESYFSTNENGWTILQVAAANGSKDCTEAVLNHMKQIMDGKELEKAKNSGGDIYHSPILLSSINGHDDVTVLLISENLSLQVFGSKNRNVVFSMCRSGLTKSIQQIISQYGYDYLKTEASIADTNGFTALHSAALMGHCDVCQYLIDANVSVSTQARDGSNSLHAACRLTQKQTLETSARTLNILFHKVKLTDLIAVDVFGSTPLHVAASCGNILALQALIRYVLSLINISDVIGVTDEISLALSPSISYLVRQDNDGYHACHIICQEIKRVETEYMSLVRDQEIHNALIVSTCNTEDEAKHDEEIQAKESISSRKVGERANKIVSLQEDMDRFMACFHELMDAGYPIASKDYSDNTIFHVLAHDTTKMQLDMLSSLLAPKENPEMKVTDIVEAINADDWTSLHIAINTGSDVGENVRFFQRICNSGNVNDQENEPRNIQEQVIQLITRCCTSSFLETFDYTLPKNIKRSKVYRQRCGAHNRISVEKRISMFPDHRYDIKSGLSYIHSVGADLGRKPKIVIVCGAGISTSAGIKDFRSSDGLYSNTSTAQLFSVDFMMNQPIAFYQQMRDLFLPVVDGVIRPTKTHALMRMLWDQGYLQRIYTQNIDMLEHVALSTSLSTEKYTGTSEEMLEKDDTAAKSLNSEEIDNLIVECHGSCRKAYCMNATCSYFINNDHDMKSQFWEYVRHDGIPKCPLCATQLRPAVTFFGEPLPEKFNLNCVKDIPTCDMLIVLGTSLLVYPVASLPSFVSPDAIRLLINREPTGCFQYVHPYNATTSCIDNTEKNSDKNDENAKNMLFTHQYETHNYRDIYYEGSCDDGAEQIAVALGLGVELQEIWSALVKKE